MSQEHTLSTRSMAKEFDTPLIESSFEFTRRKSNMADQADVKQARELLTDLHDGHHTDKFQQDLTKVSKDHRAAVEAEMRPQETAFRSLYPDSGNFTFKDD